MVNLFVDGLSEYALGYLRGHFLEDRLRMSNNRVQWLRFKQVRFQEQSW